MIRKKEGNYYYLKLEKIGYIEYQIKYEVLDITDLFIEENKRRKGYASSFIKELEKEKIDKIMLEVKEDNIKAINLYKKHGFKIINVRKKYYRHKDALIMEKIL